MKFLEVIENLQLLVSFKRLLKIYIFITDPKIVIYHNCNTRPGCLKKISMIIPDRFVAHGDKVEKWFDAGVFELSGKYPDETEKCVH